MGNNPANQTALTTVSILNVNQSVLNLEEKTHKNASKTKNVSRNATSSAANIGKVKM